MTFHSPSINRYYERACQTEVAYVKAVESASMNLASLYRTGDGVPQSYGKNAPYMYHSPIPITRQFFFYRPFLPHDTPARTRVLYEEAIELGSGDAKLVLQRVNDAIANECPLLGGSSATNWGTPIKKPHCSTARLP